MHILVVHQYFLGASDGGGSRFNEMTRVWREQGHQVTVIAGTVHYQTGRKPERYRGKWITDERTPSGVRVRRCHVSPAYNRSFAGRLWAYASFTLSATHAGVTAERPDVVVATSPPLFAGLAGWAMARRWDVPFVFEVRDLWPESAIDTGVLTNPLLIRLAYAVERFLYGHADRVTVLTPAFKRVLEREKDVSSDAILFVPNGADLRLWQPGPKQNAVRERYGLDGRFVVAYLGAHGVANHLEQIVEAATLLRDRPEIAFLLVGDGMRREALERMVEARGLDNVILTGSVPKRDAVEYCNAADACTAVLKRTDTFKTVYPNKVFDYMACARPIVLGIDGVARELVEDAGAGIFVEPENARGLADAVLRLYGDPNAASAMGRRGRDYVEKHFGREMLARRYADALAKLARRRSSEGAGRTSEPVRR